MKIRMAHLNEQGIDFAIFDADAQNGTESGRASILAQLTAAARANGLKIDKSALVYSAGGQIAFYGTPDLVQFLSNNWRPVWTHEIDA